MNAVRSLRSSPALQEPRRWPSGKIRPRQRRQSNPPPAPKPPSTRPPETPRSRRVRAARAIAPAPRPAAPAPPSAQLKESLIAADLTIEGKIEGTGHVRIAGKFKGDVNVQGDLTIEHGAKLTGGVRASKVIIAGELEGNIESAQRVELLESACSSATSRPARSPSPPVRACAARSTSAGTSKGSGKPAAARTEQRRRRMSTPRPGTAGATRTCPHCKATILESASVCPACRGHLRFDERRRRQRAQTASRRCRWKARSAARRTDGAWEYTMVLTIRNDRGEEIDRQVVGVGAMQPDEERTFHAWRWR